MATSENITVDIERALAYTHTIPVGLQRNIYDIVEQKADLVREKYIATEVSADIERALFLQKHEEVGTDTLRVVRNKPKYRYVNNYSQPFTFPDGKPIVGMRIMFILSNSHGDVIPAVDAETGDIVNNQITAYTDGFGEFSVRLWPNNRSNDDSWYRVLTDSRYVREGFIYVPESPDELKFHEAYKHMNEKYLTHIEETVAFGMDVRKIDALPFTLEVALPQTDEVPFSVSPCVTNTDSQPFTLMVKQQLTEELPLTITVNKQ